MFDKTLVPPTPSHIMILGGGLAGLSSAYHLSCKFPDTPIMVLEEQPQLGGWVRSEHVKVQDDMGHMSSVILEAGPRTIRPIVKSVLELINLLEVKSSLVLMPKMSAAAKNSFLHIPGITDESLNSFMMRRFGEPFVRTFGSAVGHGIYATDSRNLSVKAVFPLMWGAEENGRGSVVWGFLKGSKKKEVKDDYELGEMETVMKGISAYSFKDGIGTLVNVLINELKQNPRVQLQSGVGATSLHIDSPQNSFKIMITSDGSLYASHVVLTLPLPILSKLLPSSTHLPHLDANLSASVTLVNLVFPFSDILLHPPGFRYFIPQLLFGYDESNPGILGMVFDSSALPEPLLVHTHSHVLCIPTPSVGHVESMDELRAVLKGAPWEG